MAQGQSTLDLFQLRAVDETVAITWVVSEGNLCNGITIERSTDGQSFEAIYRYEGVCGSIDAPQRFDYVDGRPPLNRSLHYRLQSLGTVISPVAQVIVLDFRGNNHLMYPHPLQQRSVLYFPVSRPGTHHIQFFDGQSRLLHQQSTTTAEFELLAAHFPPGISYFKIRDENGAIVSQGKVLVVH